MSFRKDQEAARARAAETINLGSGRIYFGDRASPRFGEDTVHRMFADHQAQKSEKWGSFREERVYGFDFGRDPGFSSFQWNGPGRGYEQAENYGADGDIRAAVLEQVLRRIAARYGRTYEDVRAAYHTRRGWHADANPTEKFRVLPDGTIDLHPSQWSVIA